ncbi:hypothetical protein ATANTOWER_026210 [Ataeniobius toweri]|uniref:Uncharacterized protein n=1 Tax=Ataeniobius toweri TaxID=208326 RepID=A0ABU7BRL2_9TELE|nr:hypothetical protein [Ataeniobius toweri]
MRGCSPAQLVALLSYSKRVLGSNPGLGVFCIELVHGCVSLGWSRDLSRMDPASCPVTLGYRHPHPRDPT